MNRFARLLILILITPAFANAATVSLPLGGNYRAGRYMPVLITSDNEQGTVQLAATSALNTFVEVHSASRVVAPWLMLSESVHEPVWIDTAGARRDFPTPLHALNDNERLVGLLGVDPHQAAAIVPDAHIIPIPLDPGWTADPAPAWEALDAIVVSANNLPALAQQLDALLLAGTTIAVVSETVPTPHHDEWVHVGSLWVLHRAPLIAHDPINAEAYGPTYDWIRGRPPLDRARILLLAIIISIAVVGVALWRSRWSVWAIVAICVAGSAVVFSYDRQRPKMLELRLGVASASLLDAWTWYSPITATDTRHPFDTLSKPIFASRRQSRDLEIALNWTADPSTRAFTFKLDRNQSLAFVDVTNAPAIELVKPEVLQDLKEFADHLYIRAGTQIAGTAVVNHNGALTTVMIDRKR